MLLERDRLIETREALRSGYVQLKEFQTRLRRRVPLGAPNGLQKLTSEVRFPVLHAVMSNPCRCNGTWRQQAELLRRRLFWMCMLNSDAIVPLPSKRERYKMKW